MDFARGKGGLTAGLGPAKREESDEKERREMEKEECIKIGELRERVFNNFLFK